MMERAHASMKTIFFVNILNFTLDFSNNSRGKTHNLTLRVAGFSLSVNSFKVKNIMAILTHILALWIAGFSLRVNFFKDK